MKGIKRRQKGFVALLLVVVIGFLPAVEVLAQTFTITQFVDTDNNNANSIKINDGNTDIVKIATSGNAGTAYFYCVPDDKITLLKSSWSVATYDTVTTFVD